MEGTTSLDPSTSRSELGSEHPADTVSDDTSLKPRRRRKRKIKEFPNEAEEEARRERRRKNKKEDDGKKRKKKKKSKGKEVGMGYEDEEDDVDTEAELDRNDGNSDPLTRKSKSASSRETLDDAEEEEPWLTTGLPFKDVTKMTARQVAKLAATERIKQERERKNEEEASKGEIPPVEEDEGEEERRREKARRRKEQSRKKKETEKQLTVERLLLKKKSRTKPSKSKTTDAIRSTVPVVSFLLNSSGAFLSFPEPYDYPLKATSAPTPPPLVLCGVCGIQPKRYACSKSKTPLCSLECYRVVRANSLNSPPATEAVT